MGLDGLEQVSCVDIGELVVPDLGVILIDCCSVNVSPQFEGGLGVAEDHVQEGHNSIPLSILLSLLGVLVVGLHNAVLEVHPIDVFEATGSDFRLEDLLQPGKSRLFEDGSQVMDVETVEVDKLC